MQIREIKKEDKKEVLNLLTQLTQKQVELDIDSLINDSNCNCYVFEDDNKIIGTATLTVYLSPVKGRTGIVEDVVVSGEYRGQGLGRKLMEKLIEIAKEKQINCITLTSNPKRILARKLYESLGFGLKETGFFVLKF